MINQVELSKQRQVKVDWYELFSFGKVGETKSAVSLELSEPLEIYFYLFVFGTGC